jgi:hypothetical protein
MGGWQIAGPLMTHRNLGHSVLGSRSLRRF